MLAGMICQLTPNRSLHQPHCSDSGTCESFDQYRSISSWSSHDTMNEIDSLKVKSGPPSRQTKSTPFRVNCPLITLPDMPAKCSSSDSSGYSSMELMREFGNTSM